MPFLTQRDLALSLRTKAEKDYKAQLRAALLNPTLTREQRSEIQAKLSLVGQPRVYDAKSLPVPGAIELPRPPVSEQVALPEAALAPEVPQGKKKGSRKVPK